MRASCLGVLALAAVTASCAPGAREVVRPRQGARAARNPNVITRAELQDAAVASGDARTTIQQLRPAFFRTRGPVSFRRATAGQVKISQDYGPLQPLSQLSTFDTRSLIEVRYLSAVEATARFGINADGGSVIVLLTTTQ
jgi:hypothetical protein